MALTTLERIFELERNEPAFIPNKERIAPMINEMCPLYIPRLMPGIAMGEPSTSKITTKGTAVFKNDPACAIRADACMTIANYLTVKFEGNTKWRVDKSKIDDEKGERKVFRGLRVTCHTESNVVKDMTFSNQ